MLGGKCILLGIGGGIAAYRSAELARLLMRKGAKVRCVMTRSACEFITPMTMEALTGEAVHSELFDLTAEREMGHIQLSRWADLLLVAPATAGLLAKFTHGLCDNLLTTLFQAMRGPVLLAPAMNSVMWQAAATQANVQLLVERDMHLIGPAEGELACGEVGPGRMSEPEDIMATMLPLLVEQDLAGQHWVLNAGPTWEAWDDVRVLSNRASGRLGALLADAAAVRGAQVTLIAGPRVPACRQHVTRVDVESAQQMLVQSRDHAAGADVFIATAAVSDYRFADPISGKFKRGGAGESAVRLVENADIVAQLTAMVARPRSVVAFAAEAEGHQQKAREKMYAKGADAIFANDVSCMGGDAGSGWWLAGDDVAQQVDMMDKARLADWLVARVREMQHG